MTQETTDAPLLEAIQQGDQAALAELYDRYAGLMTGVAVKLLNNRKDAEDLVHDVFIEAWQKCASYDPERGSVRSWLMVRLRSRASDRRRSLSSARDHAVLLSVSAEPEERDEVLELMAQAQAHSLLESLDLEQRRVVDLAYFEGLTNRDIAERCNIPLGTVKSRLSRAIRALRDRADAAPGVRP